MRSFAKNTIKHFTHPKHQLSEFNDDQNQFYCNGCRTFGSGKRFRCHKCGFDLHECCATCPQTLSASFIHHHQLTLVMPNSQNNRLNNRGCSMCSDRIEGMFYMCKDCEFNLHPVCSKLPETLLHVLHQAHPLRLEAPLTANTCGVCRNVCISWRYRCGECGFHVHLDCVVKSCQQQNNERGIPKYVPRQTFYPPLPYFSHAPPPRPPYFGSAPPPSGGFPYGHPYGNPPYMYQNPSTTQPYQVAEGRVGGLGSRIFAIVGHIGTGVMSNMVFGMVNSTLMS